MQLLALTSAGTAMQHTAACVNCSPTRHAPAGPNRPSRCGLHPCACAMSKGGHSAAPSTTPRLTNLPAPTHHQAAPASCHMSGPSTSSSAPPRREQPLLKLHALLLPRMLLLLPLPPPGTPHTCCCTPPLPPLRTPVAAPTEPPAPAGASQPGGSLPSASTGGRLRHCAPCCLLYSGSDAMTAGPRRATAPLTRWMLRGMASRDRFLTVVGIQPWQQRRQREGEVDQKGAAFTATQLC
jgi:hypothetical protein